MERAFKIGCSVIFFDSYRRAHQAVVTNWFHGGKDGETVEAWKAKRRAEGYAEPDYIPGCNVAFVSEDTNKTDQYGRQIERQTSCSYGRNQSTPFLGMCWAWPDEAEEAMKLAAESYDKAVAR